MNQLHLKVQYTKYLRFDPKITILKQKYKYLPIQCSERDIKGKHHLWMA